MFYRFFISFFLLSSLLYGMADDLSFYHQANRSKFNGNIAEEFMSKYFKGSGWKQIPGEVGSNGIDGLFIKIKNGVVSDAMFVESKFKGKGVPSVKNGEISLSKSGLGTTKDAAKQMSKQWSLKKIDALIEKGDPKLKEYYKQIRKHVTQGTVKKRYFSMTKLANGKIKVILKPIQDVGLKGVKIVEGTRSKIAEHIFDLKKTKSNFDRKLAKNFNESLKANKKAFLESSRATKGFLGVVKKGGGKVIAKMAVLSSASFIPALGVAAQVAADMYIAYQIEDLQETTEENKKNIQRNRKYIQRVEEEVKIVGQQITANRQNIDLILQHIPVLDSKIQKMKKRLSEDEKSHFRVGINELQQYFTSNREDKDSLHRSIESFDYIIGNSNYDSLTKLLARNAWNIAKIEEVRLLRENNKSTSNLEDGILKNFKSIIAVKNLAVIGNAFDSMQYIFIKDIVKIKKINTLYQEYLEAEIAKLLKNKRFEDALYVANIIKTKLDISTNYKEVLAKRKQNFEKNKNNLIEIANARQILQENENELLIEEAVRVAYSEDHIDFMLEILKKYPIKNDDFKLKAFYVAYRVVDEKKAQELKSLILSNSTYSKELKEFVQK